MGVPILARCGFSPHPVDVCGRAFTDFYGVGICLAGHSLSFELSKF